VNSIFTLKRKVAIITGARRGIGKAISLAFAEAVADVVVCDVVGGSELEEVAEEVRKFGRKSLPINVLL